MSEPEDKQMQAFLKGIVGVVEAASYEKFALWEDYHQRQGRTWVQGTSGLLEAVGKFSGMPVCISLLVDVVDDHRLLFWHPTSQVIDHRLIRSGAGMPKVHNKYHGSAPADAVYIGRGSPWGNPFVIGDAGDRDRVCDLFETDILPFLDLTPLIGKDLVCFCAPKRCHGDALLRAAAELGRPDE